MENERFAIFIPLEDWIQTGITWVVANWRPFFQAIRTPIEFTLDGIEDFLLWLPAEALLGAIFLLAWRVAGWRIAVFSSASMLFVGLIGQWNAAMTTLAIIFTALVFNILIGIPIGVLAGRSNHVWAVLRPILDIMQTTPSFVYLVPVVMLFGIGTVPGVIATIIFSIAPVIRLTNLGIRQVPSEVIEAGHAYGSSELQLLRHIQIPLALPTIMAGLNQTLLLGMVMSTIASMIGAEGLGLVVLRGIGRLDVGLAATGGLCIVLIAMAIDRITQSIGNTSSVSRPNTFDEWVVRVLTGRNSLTFGGT